MKRGSEYEVSWLVRGIGSRNKLKIVSEYARNSERMLCQDAAKDISP